MATKNYYWSSVLDCVMSEQDENGDTQVSYTHEPSFYGPLVSEQREAESRQYHFDALGSTRARTASGGDVTGTLAYDAWGIVLIHAGSSDILFGWCGVHGYLSDRERSSYYVRHRCYSAAISRWSSLEQVILFRMRGFYRYADSSPAMFTDPSGLVPACDSCEASKRSALDDPQIRKLASCLIKQGCAGSSLECQCCDASGQRGCTFINESGQIAIRLCCGWPAEEIKATLLHETIHAIRLCRLTGGKPPGDGLTYPDSCSSCLAEEITARLCAGQDTGNAGALLAGAFASCGLAGIIGGGKPPVSPPPIDPTATPCSAGVHPNFSVQKCRRSDFPTGVDEIRDAVASIAEWVLDTFGDPPSPASSVCKKHFDPECGSLTLPTLPKW